MNWFVNVADEFNLLRPFLRACDQTRFLLKKVPFRLLVSIFMDCGFQLQLEITNLE